MEARLTPDGARADTLERAKALKATLVESIVRLKPPGQGTWEGAIPIHPHFGVRSVTCQFLLEASPLTRSQEITYNRFRLPPTPDRRWTCSISVVTG